MKTIKVLFLFALIAFTFTSATVMDDAATTIKIGEKVTSAGSSEIEVEFNATVGSSTYQTIYVTVDPGNSGTIQFSVGETIVAGHNAWPAGSRFPITIRNGIKNLRYKASGASQSFVCTM